MGGKSGEPTLARGSVPETLKRSAHRDPGSKRTREEIGKISQKPQTPAAAIDGGGGEERARSVVTEVSIPGSLAAWAGCGPGPLGVKGPGDPLLRYVERGMSREHKRVIAPTLWGAGLRNAALAAVPSVTSDSLERWVEAPELTAPCSDRPSPLPFQFRTPPQTAPFPF